MKGIIFLFLMVFSSQLFSQNEQFAIAGKNGIFVYLGLNIPNGQKTDFYNVERKTENGEWKAIAKIVFPGSYESFLQDYSIYKDLFPYINENIDVKDIYKNLIKASSIQDSSVRKKMNLMAIRLAAGNIFYDQNAEKHVLYRYRVTNYKIDGSHTQKTSGLENYPGITDFSQVKVLLITRTDTTNYIKWWSKNGDDPYWVAMYHYEGDNIVLDNYHITHYNVNDTIYYFTQIKKPNFKQYFIIPFDYYGNQGRPSQIAYIEKVIPAINYFSNISARRNNNLLQIDLSWDLKNNDDIKQIDILRSEDFNGEYTKISTVSNETQNYRDLNIEPDKIYYYQLDALLTFSEQHVKTVRFHGFGFENQPPVPPYLEVTGNKAKNLVFKINGSNEKFIAGVRIYRKLANSNEIPLQVSDLIKLQADTAIFVDTANIAGGYEYEYFAKSENTSHLESERSNIVRVQSFNNIKFPAISGLTHIVYDKNEVHLYWDDIRQKNPSIAGYRIYRKKKNEDWQLLIKKDSLFMLNNFLDKGLSSGNYDYKICPLDFMFREGPGSITKVTIIDSPELKGCDLSLTKTDKGILIKVSQISIEGIKKYKIYRYIRGKKPKVIAELPVITGEFIDKKVKKEKLYFYYITFIDHDGNESLPGREVGLRY